MAQDLSLLELDMSLVKMLAERKLHNTRDIFAKTPFDLVELLDLPYDQVEQLLDDIASKIAPAPISALEMWRQSRYHLPTAFQPLNTALHGGLPAASITELVGPASLGKTQFCLTMTVLSCRHNKRGSVLYIDTESKFSPQRLAEIAVARYPNEFGTEPTLAALLDRVIVAKPEDSEDLLRKLNSLESIIRDQGVSFIVIDSIAALARTADNSVSLFERQRMLGRQASKLKYLSETFSIPVLVTNQVTTVLREGTLDQAPVGAGVTAPNGMSSASTGQLTAALGTGWAHAVNTRLVVEYVKGFRYLRIAKSPAAPSIAVAYHITSAGVEAVNGEEVPGMEGSVIDMEILNEQPFTL